LNTFLAAATSAFLFLAPFTGSAGLRTAVLLLAAIALAASWRTHVAPYAQRIPLAIAATFAAWALLAVASLMWSVDRAYTLYELRTEIAYPVLAVAVFFLVAQQPGRWRTWCIALLAGTAVVFALHMAQRTFGFSLSRHAVFEQRGPWSTHLVLMAPLVLALAWQPPWGAGRGVAIGTGAMVLLLFAAWETDNRIIWVALAVQFLIVAAMRPAGANGGTRALRRMAVVAALVATAALAASIIDRSALHFAGASDSLERDVRPRIWGVAWDRFSQAPVLGHGFGREILSADFIPQTPRVLNHPQIRHGHNVFVDVALELGLVGLAVFVALLALLAREYRGYLERAELAPLGTVGLAVVAGFVVKCLTDDFLYRHNGLVFWSLNAMLLGLARSTPRPMPRAEAAPP
jgi:O-antigen ligase